MPRWPSEALRLAEAGYDADTILEVDLAIVGFGMAFDAAKAATKEVPHTGRKRKPMRVVPKYSDEQLRRFLGIDEAIDEDGEPVFDAPLDPSLWEWEDEEDG